MRQVSTFAEHLRRRHEADVVDRDVAKLRTAALLHDLTHGPFSHTSEDEYRFWDDMPGLVGHGGEFEGCSPSEVVTYLAMTSSAFTRFSERLTERYKLKWSPVDVADWITGQARHRTPRIGHLIDMLNGPVDADKLDYISRDAHHTGLPLAVDVDRLWYSTRVVSIPRSIGLRPSPRRLGCVVARAGVTALEQIVFARMVLTAGVYHHHKVRACDCMLRALLRYARERELTLAGHKLDSPANLLWFDDESLLASAYVSSDAFLRRLAMAIKERNLFFRALIISSVTVDFRSRAEPHILFEQLAGESKSAQGSAVLRELASAIWKRAKVNCSPFEVWLDFPPTPKLGDLENALVNGGDDDHPELMRLGEFLPLTAWGRQYTINKWRGHVFCPAPHVERVGKAAAEVLSEKLGVTFKNLAYPRRS